MPTILVVEDEPNVREVLARALRAQDYAILEAANGADARQLLDEQGAAIDLLITDMRLPYVQGDELIAAVTARYPGVRVLCISGYPGTIDVEAGYEYLLKPFTRDQLLAKIRKILER